MSIKLEKRFRKIIKNNLASLRYSNFGLDISGATTTDVSLYLDLNSCVEDLIKEVEKYYFETHKLKLLGKAVIFKYDTCKLQFKLDNEFLRNLKNETKS